MAARGKNKKALTVVIGLVTLAIFSLLEIPARANNIEFVIASWEPPDGTGMAPLRDWLKELSNRTAGKVSGKIAYGSALGKAPQHYDMAVSGMADISYVGLPYTPGRFQMAEVIQLPVTGEASNETMAEAFFELAKKGYFDQDFKEVKLLWVATTIPYDYQMGNTAVKTFEDMKGKKIRGSGAVHTEIIKALGSIPVGIAGPEVYVSLDKGIIDGCFGPWSFIKAFGLAPVVKSVTEVGVGGFNFAVVMNKSTYDRLPSEIKATIDEISPKYSAISGKRHDLYANEGKALLKQAGGVVYKLPSADMEKLDKALAPVWQKWIAEGEAKNLPRKKLVDEFYTVLKGKGIRKPFYGYGF